MQSPETLENLPYEPAFDGLRALAVAAVVLVHCHVPGFAGGYLGVDLFFVLSGFLITEILVREFAHRGSINLPGFYLRRARRLYPALLLMLAGYLLLAPLIWPGHAHLRDALITAGYLSDYSYTFFGVPKYLGHTWSLAAEEHFYLLWPPALLFALRRISLETLAKWLAVAALVAWAWRTGNIAAGMKVGHRFDTRAVGLIMGCWMAVALHCPGSLLRNMQCRRAGIAGAALAMALLIVSETSFARLVPRLPLIEVASLGLVLGAHTLPLKAPLLVQGGKLSYGIYLWHFPLVKAVSAPWYVEAAIVVPTSIVLAWISFNTVESWARRLSTARQPVMVSGP